MSTNTPTSADPFGLQMLKPTKTGGQVWFMYNTDFNDDPQVYTESASLEYVLHNVVDADGTQFTIANDAAFKAYISTTTGLVPSQTITDQQEMARRGYMQNAQDWRNVEITGQMVIFTESTTDFITIGIRGGKDVGTGSPQGCTGSRYLVEFAMTHGGLVRVRKKSWNTSVHNWLSVLASGFDATKVCGWSFKILCYNTQDSNGVNVEVWLAPLNDNHFVKVLSGVDTGQLNTDANICNCTNVGQPLTWGGPTILLQGNSGKFGFKNMSVREIEGFGTTLPPIDPNPTPDPGTGGTGGGGTGTGGGSGGGGGGGSGSGTGGTGGGGGVPVDLTPVLATPHTAYVEYGGGPNFSPLEIHTIFAGSAWNSTTSASAPSTAITTEAPTAAATTTQTADPILAAPKSNAYVVTNNGQLFPSVTVHFIFWGSDWNTRTTPWSKAQIMDKMDKLFKSTYFDGLIQYDYCRRPKIGSIVVNTTYAPVNNFDGQDLGNVIIDSINRNLVPDHGYSWPGNPQPPYHMYYIVGTQGHYSSDSFSPSASFHFRYQYQADDTSYIYGYTENMEYAGTDIKWQTYGMSHELVESITDPFPGFGVLSADVDPLLGDVGELADVCSTEYTVNTVVVSGYWSNEDNACIAPTAKPTWISCASGFTWNPTTQLCERTVTTPVPPPTTPDTVLPLVAVPSKAYVRYEGGPDQNPLQFYFIFVGSAWSSGSNATLRSQIMADMAKVFNAGYFDPLYQYDRRARPALKGSVILTSPTLSNGYGVNEVYPVCETAGTTAGLVPWATSTTNRNVAYFVLALPGVTGHSGTLGEHYSIDNTGTRSIWHIMGWAQTYSDPSLYYVTTAAITHEMAEMVSDNVPIDGFKAFTIKPGTPLQSKVDQFGFEICDVCEEDTVAAETGLLDGVTVSKYWSDQDNKCIIPVKPSNPSTFKPTWISCPSGYTWNNDVQLCVKTGTPPPPPPPPTPDPTPNPTPDPDPTPTPDPGTNVQTTPAILATPTTAYTILVPPDTVDPLQVYFIFWGPTWATSTGATQKTTIMNNMTTIFNSAYFDALYQYGRTKRPVLKGSVVSTSLTINNPFAISEPRLVIQDCISKNQVPGNRVGFENNAYIVVLPAGFHETGKPLSTGAHTNSTTTNSDGSSYRLFWAWVALPSAGNTQTIEEITTHELAELVTSNNPLTGYVIKQGTPLQTTIDTYGIEIADACEDTLSNRHGTLSGLTVSKYWSDQSGSCTFSTAKPAFISCPTGYTWNNTTQQCEKAVTVPSQIVANSALKTQTQNAITTLINSTYFTGLYQYGLTKKPTVGTFVVNTTNAVIPNKYTQTQITALVNDSIAKNQVPAASSTKKNIAYLVILPPRIGYTTGAIGVHYANEFNPTTPTTQYFQIISTASLNITFNDFTKTISEALIGVVSQNNPTGGGKGYNIKAGTPLDLKIQSNGDELYSPCRDDVSNNTISGITVAKYWSDQDGACIIPQSSANPTPWATCHTGATFDQPTQTCKLLPGGTGGGTTPTGGGGQGYTVALANASSDDGNVPANAIDGKLDTRWSAFGKGQFLRLDLGTAKKVNKIKIAWYQGDKRANHFEITTAEVQGGAYSSQLITDSQKGSTALQDYAINPPNPVRYIRIIVNGNTLNDWASISEVEVWGPDVPAGTPSTGTGGDPGSGGTVPGGDTGGGTQTPPPATEASYNFFDTSFSVDYQKIGLCNPVE
jgi:hypothetical protein